MIELGGGGGGGDGSIFKIFDIRESPAKFEYRIKPRVYVRRITRSTMYENTPFCWSELA